MNIFYKWLDTYLATLRKHVPYGEIIANNIAKKAKKKDVDMFDLVHSQMCGTAYRYLVIYNPLQDHYCKLVEYSSKIK